MEQWFSTTRILDAKNTKNRSCNHIRHKWPTSQSAVNDSRKLSVFFSFLLIVLLPVL
jgi:hypothetical protein